MYEPKIGPGGPEARVQGAAQPPAEGRKRPKGKGQGDVALLTRICAALVAVTVIAAGYGTYALVTSSQRNAFLAEQTRSVVVATADVERGDTVDAGKLTVMNIPASTVPEGAATEVGQVAGKKALRDIPVKAVVTGADVSGEGARSLAGKVAQGKVAVTVSVTQQTGDAGLIRQGDRVTLLGSSGSAASSEASLLAASAKVLACGSSLEAHNPEYTSVTVEVTPEQARTVALAASTGTVTCVVEPSGQEG